MTARVREVSIVLRDVSTPRELHECLRNALTFPGWYGHNWDAFWDAITGLVDMPHRLRFIGWSILEDRLPTEAQKLRECLEEMQMRLPELAACVSYE